MPALSTFDMTSQEELCFAAFVWKTLTGLQRAVTSSPSNQSWINLLQSPGHKSVVRPPSPPTHILCVLCIQYLVASNFPSGSRLSRSLCELCLDICTNEHPKVRSEHRLPAHLMARWGWHFITLVAGLYCMLINIIGSYCNCDIRVNGHFYFSLFLDLFMSVYTSVGPGVSYLDAALGHIVIWITLQLTAQH